MTDKYDPKQKLLSVSISPKQQYLSTSRDVTFKKEKSPKTTNFTIIMDYDSDEEQQSKRARCCCAVQ